MTMPNWEKEDIYLRLLEDITGLKKIDPDTPIIQSSEEKRIAGHDARNIDDVLKASCNTISQKLSCNDMHVGSSIGYTEPCPIEYTGNIRKGKKFHTVFIGLNPFNEGVRSFPHDMKFADLANIHHPNDIRHNREIQYYAPCAESKFQNNYWRVLGNKEGNKSWSPFFQFVIRIYLSLLSDCTKLDDIKKENLTNYLLDKLAEFPMANAELIPYKSPTIDMIKYEELLQLENYNKYLIDMMDFIDKYADNEAYIFATISVSGDNGTTPALDLLYRTLKKYLIKEETSPSIQVDEFYVYNKENNKLESGKTKKAYDLAPMYITRWKDENNNKNRKVIITSPFSRRNRYSWIYDSHEWLDTIKNHFSV